MSEHIPVLQTEVMLALADLNFSAGTFLDATFGRGGHTRKILEAHKSANVIALDQDLEAIRAGERDFKTEIQQGRLQLIQTNFIHFKKYLGGTKLVGALLDLGVSSPQLDEGPRGFSFYHNGPLDMRMDQGQDYTAATIVNTWSKQELEKLFQQLGEVQRPGRVVDAIILERKKAKFETTGKLAELIEKTDGWRKKGHHPATNYFMALRMHVNQELEVIAQILPEVVACIGPEGRVLVITFHSLEDRIVKNIFRDFEDREIAFRVNKKVIVPERAEQLSNPRSRSAKLRVLQRGKRV